MEILTLTTAAIVVCNPWPKMSALLVQPPQEFTIDFALDRCASLVPDGGNDYFSLRPGRFSRFEGEDEGQFVELEITVLDEQEVIPFRLDGRRFIAVTRVIEEREWIDGELVEVSRNYFARCSDADDVFYFGEDVDIYKNGQIIGHDGTWRAGVDGARPGLIMPALYLLGAKYYQEIAPPVAADRASHVGMNISIETPFGAFEDCVVVLETTPLEPGERSIKVYSAGVGLVRSDFLELVDFHE